MLKLLSGQVWAGAAPHRSASATHDYHYTIIAIIVMFCLYYYCYG